MCSVPVGEGPPSGLVAVSGRSFLKVGSQCLQSRSSCNWTTVASAVVAD